VYYVKDAEEIVSREMIRHLDLHRGVVTTKDWLPEQAKVEIVISAGASCPDAMVEAVLNRIVAFFPGAAALGDAVAQSAA
jgi:4-hydroxy-3-methylbut-2-enyl diphosphate reductase